MAITSSQGFYSYLLPKEHKQDIFRIILLVLALGVVVFSGWAYSVIFGSVPEMTPTATVAPTRAVVLTDEDRAAMMAKPSGLPLQNPTLTDAQRSAIMGKPAGKISTSKR